MQLQLCFNVEILTLNSLWHDLTLIFPIRHYYNPSKFNSMFNSLCMMDDVVKTSKQRWNGNVEFTMSSKPWYYDMILQMILPYFL